MKNVKIDLNIWDSQNPDGDPLEELLLDWTDTYYMEGADDNYFQFAGYNKAGDWVELRIPMSAVQPMLLECRRQQRNI
jgi:hypothetical protein